jgi:hypothetical protein
VSSESSPAIAVATLYQKNLVTRQTGRAVRDGIERLISGRREAIAVIDFRDVAVIDFSCADEVVAKLLLRLEEASGEELPRFVIVRGVHEHHLDPVEGALRRRGLAVSAERIGGEQVLLGETEPDAEAAWRMLCACGRIRSDELARRMGVATDSCDLLLSDLLRRRLVRRNGELFESLFFTASVARQASERKTPGSDEGAVSPTDSSPSADE